VTLANSCRFAQPSISWLDLEAHILLEIPAENKAQRCASVLLCWKATNSSTCGPSRGVCIPDPPKNSKNALTTSVKRSVGISRFEKKCSGKAFLIEFYAPEDLS